MIHTQFVYYAGNNFQPKYIYEEIDDFIARQLHENKYSFHTYILADCPYLSHYVPFEMYKQNS